MLTQWDKLDRTTRRRVRNAKVTGDQFDSPKEGAGTASPSTAFWDDAPQLSDFREQEGADVAFQSLLADVNRELAKLLRDVRRQSRDATLYAPHNRPIGELLIRAIQCAAKQHVLQAELANLALTDELTGFYNRRGFQAVAERQLKLGRRSRRGMLLFYIDVDGLKRINDSFGHSEGDQALKCAAEAFAHTFRDSDVIARLGGDEFAVLAVEASGHSEDAILARLRKYLDTVNERETRYNVSLSVGVARFDPRKCTSLEQLMVLADQAMYAQKHDQSAARVASPEVTHADRC